MKKQVLYLLAVIAVAAMVFVTSCQKEESFEGSNTPAKGSLQADVSGDCLPKTVNGVYAAGTALVPGTNTITVQVNVTQTGTYVVTTDTVNGYFFRATGTFTTLGPATVTLRGNGTPFAQGTNNFVVSFDGTICDIQVTVLAAGTGAAAFTLVSGGAPPNCANAVVSGTYTQNIPLAPLTNYVDISVNVTTVGSYTITATGGGMTFSKSGAFTATGNQTVRLDGGGTPTGAAGPTTITFTTPAAFSTCSFTVTVAAGAGAAVYTMNCAGATVNGTYTAGTALTAANTITIPITVTTPGTYTLSGTINGMTFANSGTLTAGTTTITLNGTGTPAAAGSFNLSVGSCTIPITVGGAAAAVYTLNCGGATVNGTYTAGVALTAANTITIPITLTSPGTYSISAGPVNGMTFANSGTLTAGTTSITLNGTGTPTTSGTFNFTVGSCTIPVTCNPAPSNDYYPRTIGSNWSYEFDDVANDSLLRYVKNVAPLTVSGNNFTRFFLNDGSGEDSSGYYRKNGGDYFEWFDFGDFVGLDNSAWTEYIMLKDNVALNTNWKTGAVCGTAGATPICIRWSFTIRLKDGSLSITTSTGTVNYQNVIEVEEKLDYSLDGGTTWQDATAIVDYYSKSHYARGIGLIKFEAFHSNNTPYTGSRQELRRYQVF